jgi:hypothetical protein
MAQGKQARAAEHKRQKEALRAADPNAIWRFVRFATMEDAVDFANVDPAQKGGEFGAAPDPAGGGIGGYYFF